MDTILPVHSDTGNLAIFLEGKDEPFSPSNGYVKWARLITSDFGLKLKRTCFEGLDPDDLDRTVLCIIAGPRQCFTSAEFDALNTFVEVGISILLLAGEGGQEKLETNINSFLGPRGIKFSRDSVMRRLPHNRYLHPQQAIIEDGFLPYSPLLLDQCPDSLTVLYPFGCTLDIQKPAIPLVTSGEYCYPVQRALCALALPDKSDGKIIAFGSLFAFHDDFIEKEENSWMIRQIIRVVLMPNATLRQNSAKYPEAGDTRERTRRQFLFPQKHLVKPLLDREFFKCAGSGEIEFAGLEEDDFVARCRVEAAVLEAAKDLDVSWDLETLSSPPPLKGWLPRVIFPIVEPQLRLPGRPTLEYFDIDELITSYGCKQDNILTAETNSTKLMKAAEDSGMGCRRSSKAILKHMVQTISQAASGQNVPYAYGSDVWTNAGTSRSDSHHPSSNQPSIKLENIRDIMEGSLSLCSTREAQSDAEILAWALNRHQEKGQRNDRILSSNDSTRHEAQ